MRIGYPDTGYRKCGNLEILGRTDPAFVRYCDHTYFLAGRSEKIRLHLTGKPVYNIILGGVTGTIWLGASVGILSILGVVQIEGKNQIAMLWLWLLAAFLNTVMQEMLVRGYLYQMIKVTVASPPRLSYLRAYLHLRTAARLRQESFLCSMSSQ